MTDKVYLDANILIAHQVKDHNYHQKATKLIDDFWLKKCILAISALTMDEFFYGIVFILQRSQQNIKTVPFATFAPKIEKATQAILSWNTIELVEFKNNPHEIMKTINIMKNHNFRPRDAFHLRIMQQNGIDSIATFDNDFNRLKNIGINIIS